MNSRSYDFLISVVYVSLFNEPFVNQKLWNLEIYDIFILKSSLTDAYSVYFQRSEIEHFAKIVNGLQALTISAKNSLLDFSQGSK